jgi:hypothetical protein
MKKYQWNPNDKLLAKLKNIKITYLVSKTSFLLTSTGLIVIWFTIRCSIHWYNTRRSNLFQLYLLVLFHYILTCNKSYHPTGSLPHIQVSTSTFVCSNVCLNIILVACAHYLYC